MANNLLKLNNNKIPVILFAAKQEPVPAIYLLIPPATLL